MTQNHLFDRYFVLIRGAGELASAAAISLFRCGFKIVMTDIPEPLAIRRTVSFCTAIYNGTIMIENVTGRFSPTDRINFVIQDNQIPVIIDDPNEFSRIDPDAIIDARMLKSDQPKHDTRVEKIIGLGPGFQTGKNCRLAIETKRGHDLGRIIPAGSTGKDTGIPGTIAGENIHRIIRAPGHGSVEWQVDIGDLVSPGQTIGSIDKLMPVTTRIAGKVRGLIYPGLKVPDGLKIADIDPRGSFIDHNSISDKARCIGRAVLEATVRLMMRNTDE